MSQELHTFIVPDGGIQLEWLSSEVRIDKSRQCQLFKKSNLIKS